MLVLSRKVGEKIIIGPNASVTIIEIHGDRVRLGFEAPRCVAIHREEVHRRIQREEQGESLRQSAQAIALSS